MGVMRDKGPNKSRSGVAVQHHTPSPRAAQQPPSPRAAQQLPSPRAAQQPPLPRAAQQSPLPRAAQQPPLPRAAQFHHSPRPAAPPSVAVKAAVAASTPPARRKEDEKLRGTSVQSLEKYTTSSNNTSKTKIGLDASEPKENETNEEKNDQKDTENSILLALSDMSLNEDNDLNKQIKNLSIKDNKKEKEQNEESDLLSRGPDRACITGNTRTVPYIYEQHLVSSDKHGGGTVLYPNISPPHQVINYPQNQYQELYAENLPNTSQDSGIFPNGDYFNGSFSELENLLPGLPEEPIQLKEEDLRFLRSFVEKEISNLNDPFNDDIDKIIESKKDDKDLQPIKRELCEGVMDRQLAPTTPDSAYDSDECSVGSPSSVASGVIRTEREKVVPVSSYTHVVAQPTNLHTQSGFAPAPVSPVIQTLTVQSPMLLVLQQQPKTVMPPPPPPILPQLQQQPQPLAPPSTPPLSPQVLRPILPGINIPAACNKCSEPAINRIRSIMVEEVKDRAWAVMFAYPETKFTDKDEDGNMLLSCVLSNCQKIDNFMEVLYALIHRLKEIINKNKQMALKLLATPNKNGHTPLDIACRFLRSNPKNALAVRYLAETMVEEGIAIGEDVDGNGNSLLHKLCACGDKACCIMAELLSMKDQQGNCVFDVNQRNHEGKTPLHIAAQTHSEQNSCTGLAQLLMRSGADVSQKEGCAGNTVFHLVARESCDPNLLVTLLAKTSYASKVINEKNFNEDTALHMVAANHTIHPTRQRLAVQHLIDYGADPRIQNKSRKAPLSLVPAERKQDIKNVLYHKRQVISQE